MSLLRNLKRTLLDTDCEDDIRLGLARPKPLKTATQHIADHVEHAVSPYDSPPMPLPYGGTGGAEQLIVCSANVTVTQPANMAGFCAFSPCFNVDGESVQYTTSAFASTTIQTEGNTPVTGVNVASIVGSQLTLDQLTEPTVAAGGSNGGVKCKWTQCFFRARCIDNVTNRGGDGFIGQVSQQGGCDSNGVGMSSFNTLIQQRLIKKLVTDGEWNDWHCTTYEEDLRYHDTQFSVPRCGIAEETQDPNAITQSIVYPYFLFLYPNASAHTWEVEIYFTFQVDGNAGLVTPNIQPNIQDIPHVSEAANINAAVAYARRMVGAGNTKHTSFKAHVSNFFKSVGHDLKNFGSDVYHHLGDEAIAAGIGFALA